MLAYQILSAVCPAFACSDGIGHRIRTVNAFHLAPAPGCLDHHLPDLAALSIWIASVELSIGQPVILYACPDLRLSGTACSISVSKGSSDLPFHIGHLVHRGAGFSSLG